MKLEVSGIIDPYYVQTLCLIFMPGAKFGASEAADPTAPALRVRVEEREGGIWSEAHFTFRDTSSHAENFTPYKPNVTARRTGKISCGAAVIEACKRVFGDVSEWGMLTGVRPSKLAAEVLLSADSRAEAEKILMEEYFLTENKTKLVTEVAERELELLGRTDKNHCSVYISIPFCPSKCTYCSFTSYASPKLYSLIPDYLVALGEDIRRVFRSIKEQSLTVDTVYIGGGTPTMLTADQLSYLLSVLGECVNPCTLMEFTLEGGRPDTLTAEKLRIAAEGGVTRLSVNPQTLNDTILKSIGRNHTVEDFMKAYDLAVSSDIPHINADLIAGLPGESAESFRYTVDTILSLAPANITVHTFCVKRAAEILRQDQEIYHRDTAIAKESVSYSQSAILAQGYVPYYMYRQKNTVGNFENVGFAKPGTEGVYNVFMMQEAHTIFGVGAGAVTKLVHRTSPKEVFVERLFYPKYPFEYLEEKKNGSERYAVMEKRIAEFYSEHKE